jgi:hypothetical protein
MMLRRFACKYSTRDIVEEYRNITVCPLLDGWAIADDAWADDIGGIPCPDWTKAFGFTSAREYFYPLRCSFPVCPSTEILCDHCLCSLLDSAEEEEGGGPRRFHPRPRVAEGV